MELLKQLVNLNGISGDEHDVRSFIIKEARKYTKDVKVDKMGNVIVHKKGKKPTILFLAHMDEIGLMVSHIQGNGKINISEIGGIDPSILLGQRVFVKGKEKINGIITHDDTLNDLNIMKVPKVEELYVYTGMTKEELKKKGVEIGSYISFDEEKAFVELGSSDIISGKALDDRIGCYILLELIRNLKTKNDVYFVFTVQEEIGLYGSKATVFNLEPDYAIAIDVTGHNDSNGTIIAGNGPVLTIKDAEMLGNKCLNDAIEDVADKLNIDIQPEVSEMGTTDAASVFAAKGGIPSAVLGVAVGNLHTTVGIASKRDIQNAVKLLLSFLKNPPNKCWA